MASVKEHLQTLTGTRLEITRPGANAQVSLVRAMHDGPSALFKRMTQMLASSRSRGAYARSCHVIAQLDDRSVADIEQEMHVR